MKPINQKILAFLFVILIAAGEVYASPLAVRKIKSMAYKEYCAKVVDGKVFTGDVRKRIDLYYDSSQYETGFVEVFYNRKGKPIEKRFYPDPLSNTDSVDVVKYTYDSEGRLLRQIAGNGFKEALAEFRYDSQGKILYCRRETNGIPNTIQEMFYYYSDRGMLDSCVTKHSSLINSTTIFNYEFHPNGKMKIKKKTHPDYSEVWFYDIDGVLTSSESIWGNDSTTCYKFLYASDGGVSKIFNHAGRLTEEFERYGNLEHGELLSVSKLYPEDLDVKCSWTETLYNHKGDLLSVYSFRRTERGVELHSSELYVYKYDRYGNWTERIVCRNGEPRIITEREIVYY